MAALKRLFGGFRKAKGRAKAESEAEAAIQWVIAGLGNPGEPYARTRHNAGFMTIDRIAKANRVELNRRRFKGLTAEVILAAQRTMLVKPQTFYNLSGECLADLLGYFKVPAERLIVVHDELDIEAGRLRLKRGGSDAGNRGVRSVAEALGTPDFIRIRIGLGRPPGDEQSKDYLLRPLAAAEREAFAPNLDRAAGAAMEIIESGLERAMNRYNQRL
ncbi:MAG: aminoacyl-tRNA hydrolase [Candidatus Binatus sp.]|uniref:aminoacyl-tRNA hydrolase n=1 Tax=Candidatus Binatus sp. TaxID=2811406 RepID=UPI002721C7D0|nr:aminoacyl-tRNA hydrolase [Candidatus Binatus sp.]MDO8433898.1 aminoacyl-tRNA hydrolase [Candidatus Binatus sp.]